MHVVPGTMLTYVQYMYIPVGTRYWYLVPGTPGTTQHRGEEQRVPS